MPVSQTLPRLRPNKVQLYFSCSPYNGILVEIKIVHVSELLIEENQIFTKTICMDADHHGYKHYNVHSLYGHAMSMATDE